MRIPISAAVLLLVPAVSFAQTKEIDDAVKTKLAALKYVYALEDKAGGFKADPDAKTGLRATSSAVRAIKYLGGKVAVPDKHAAYVMACYDPKTGGFADTPGGKPDVTTTCIGVMAAVELGIPRDQFAKAMDYVGANAKTFEEVRIGAAAVEAWGLKECPFKFDRWLEVVDEFGKVPLIEVKEGGARNSAGYTVTTLRLGRTIPPEQTASLVEILQNGQRDDGGWAKPEGKGSDLESTYRVMRAFYVLKQKPKDVAKLRAFLGECRNADGGFGVQPGQKSGVSGTYYYAIITKWLGELEAK
jgi:prenyltransferase beta subunit